jgi:long-chain acyl-CoA synthetase
MSYVLSWETALAEVTAEGMPHELEPRAFEGYRVPSFKHLPAHLSAIYRHAADAHGEKPFLVYEEERLTFAEAWAKAQALAAALETRFAVAPGDRVAIALRNYPEWILAFMAATALGAVAVPMNAWWTAEELAYGLKDSDAKVVVVDDERLARLGPARAQKPELAVVTVRSAEDDASTTPLASLLEAFAGQPCPAHALSVDDDAMILYTSGTTGFPKGAVSTHYAVLSALLAFESNQAIFARRAPAPPEAPVFDPAMLVSVPLFHVTGCNAIFLTAFRPGRKLVLMYKWNAEQALALIERERVTSFTGVPTMTWEMLQCPTFDQYDTSSLQSIGGGGAPAPPEQVRQVEARFKGRPGIGYGLTESNAVGAQNNGDDYLAKPRSTGRCPCVVAIEAFDDAGQQCPRGELGELWMKGPHLFRGYWNRPEATAEVLQNGWFKTGDIGRVDEEGFVTIEDRKKDMVLRGGENVYCAEVEGALYELPGVSEAIVFGLPHERLGEEVAAVIVPTEGAQFEAEAVRARLRETLAHFKVPSQFFFQREPLPRNASGKFLKRAVRDALLAAGAQGA